MRKAALYIVLSFREPGPRWHEATGRVPRVEAVRAVAEEWRLGRLARCFLAKPRPARADKSVS